jgi:hypothetical protein
MKTLEQCRVGGWQGGILLGCNGGMSGETDELMLMMEWLMLPRGQGRIRQAALTYINNKTKRKGYIREWGHWIWIHPNGDGRSKSKMAKRGSRRN